MAHVFFTVLILVVLFVSAFVRSALGFGEALIAVPLLALVMPIEIAAPIAVLVSITIAGAVLLQDWRHVQLRSAARLVAATLAGIPVGLLLLLRMPDGIVKAWLGLSILGFSAYFLLHRNQAVLKDDRLAWTFGFSAGVLGGAYGMNGPPLALYGTLRGWSPRHFRATLQGYFLPASVLSMAGFWLVGLWNQEVTHYYLVSLPGVLIATLLGRALNGRMSSRIFLRYVNVGLLLVAGMLLMQSLRTGGAHARTFSANKQPAVSGQRFGGHLIRNAALVPAGIVAVDRAQEHGYSYSTVAR